MVVRKIKDKSGILPILRYSAVTLSEVYGLVGLLVFGESLI